MILYDLLCMSGAVASPDPRWGEHHRTSTYTVSSISFNPMTQLVFLFKQVVFKLTTGVSPNYRGSMCFNQRTAKQEDLWGLLGALERWRHERHRWENSEGLSEGLLFWSFWFLCQDTFFCDCGMSFFVLILHFFVALGEEFSSQPQTESGSLGWAFWGFQVELAELEGVFEVVQNVSETCFGLAFPVFFSVDFYWGLGLTAWRLFLDLQRSCRGDWMAP